MVSEFGMSPLGPIHLGNSNTPHSQALLDRVEDATTAIIDAQMNRAREIVTASNNGIAKLVEALLERDTLDADEILECFGLRNVQAA
jgi:cell division protease FtsH